MCDPQSIVVDQDSGTDCQKQKRPPFEATFSVSETASKYLIFGLFGMLYCFRLQRY